MDRKDFVIAQVGWLTKVPGNESRRSDVVAWFRILIEYLQRNGLTQRTLLPAGAEIEDELAIRMSDLTAEGFELMKQSFDKWVSAIDEGLEPTDTKILDKALKKIRGD